MLTGKAKEDFEKWLMGTKPIVSMDIGEWFNILYPEFQSALIISWFESGRVAITIDKDSLDSKMIIVVWGGNGALFPKIEIDCSEIDASNSFIEWWEAAIKKANEIYNSEQK